MNNTTRDSYSYVDHIYIYMYVLLYVYIFLVWQYEFFSSLVLWCILLLLFNLEYGVDLTLIARFDRDWSNSMMGAKLDNRTGEGLIHWKQGCPNPDCPTECEILGGTTWIRGQSNHCPFFFGCSASAFVFAVLRFTELHPSLSGLPTVSAPNPFSSSCLVGFTRLGAYPVGLSAVV